MESRMDMGFRNRDNMKNKWWIDDAGNSESRGHFFYPGLKSGRSGFTRGDVYFPEGTLFRGYHKGVYHYGRVESGALVLGNGKPYFSFSAAAKTITIRDTDGVLFWEFMCPGESQWSSLFKALGKDSEKK